MLHVILIMLFCNNFNQINRNPLRCYFQFTIVINHRKLSPLVCRGFSVLPSTIRKIVPNPANETFINTSTNALSRYDLKIAFSDLARFKLLVTQGTLATCTFRYCTRDRLVLEFLFKNNAHGNNSNCLRVDLTIRGQWNLH